ncbi:phage/plasmid primase, P4 family [Amycolatopsis sp. lyj-346]|uniref:DNA primase family protein n=1 Tax=Amycolatopsis sp. lyj-346 TaxID=2789289 RepID=UPI00397B79EA
MTTPQEWRAATASLPIDSWATLGKPNALADLADRLHLITEQDDGKSGARWLLEHLAYAGVDAEHWEKLLALHPYARRMPSLSPAQILQMLLRDVESGRSLDELGLAERIVVQRGPDLAWSKALGGWISWDGARWRTDDGDHRAQGASVRTVRSLAHEVAAAEARAKAASEEEAEGAEKWAAAVRRFQHESRKGRVINSALNLSRSEGLAVHPELFDARPELLTVANGTIELDTKATLREHRRVDRLTRVAAASYDPDAYSAEWEKFVEHVIPDPETRAYAQKLAGYSLLGRNTKRLMVFMMGPTSSGKSTFVEVIGAVLGDHASTFNLSLFAAKESDAPRPDVVDALPTRFLHTSEASDRWQLSADQIKRLIGDETQSARGMRSDQFLKRKPAFTPWIATNEPPTINGADKPLWRRLVVVPCGESVEQSKEDTSLAQRFGVEQRDAVLAWLIDGWDAFQEEGLEMPDAVVKATLALRDGLSVLDTWMAEEAEQDAAYTATPADLWDAFSNWCHRSGVSPADRGNMVAFGKKLSGKGIGTGWGTGKPRRRVRTGIRLTEDAARSLIKADD